MVMTGSRLCGEEPASRVADAVAVTREAERALRAGSLLVLAPRVGSGKEDTNAIRKSRAVQLPLFFFFLTYYVHTYMCVCVCVCACETVCVNCQLTTETAKKKKNDQRASGQVQTGKRTRCSEPGRQRSRERESQQVTKKKKQRALSQYRIHPNVR